MASSFAHSRSRTRAAAGAAVVLGSMGISFGMLILAGRPNGRGSAGLGLCLG